MSLLTPFYMKKLNKTEKRNKAVKLVEAISDREKLLKIAREAQDYNIRRIAAIGAKDEATLAELLLIGPDQSLSSLGSRIFTMNHIEDQEILARIARESTDKYLVWEVVNRIDNQKILKELADTSVKGRSLAVSRLKSPETVMLYINDPDREVRAAVAGHHSITSTEIHDRILLEDPDPWVRGTVIHNQKGPVSSAALAKALLEDESKGVRVSAAKAPNCIDTAALCKALLEDPDWEVRQAAVGNPYCNDPAVLSKAALEDPNEYVRRDAALRPEMKDEQTLIQMITDKENGMYIRMKMLRKGVVRDQKLLTEIALNPEEEKEVRASAVAFLEESDTLDRLIREDEQMKPYAALRLGHIRPKAAIPPLVEMVRRHGWPIKKYGYTKEELGEAIDILITQYRTTDDPEIRKRIAGLSDGTYGINDSDACGDHHTDLSQHFDLSAYR